VLSSKRGALSVPAAMLSDEYLKEKLKLREMTHQAFTPPESIGMAKAAIDMKGRELVECDHQAWVPEGTGGILDQLYPFGSPDTRCQLDR
jgi:hypothetical protein